MVTNTGGLLRAPKRHKPASKRIYKVGFTLFSLVTRCPILEIALTPSGSQ